MTEEIKIDGMDITDCEQAKSCDCCRCKNMSYYRLKQENKELIEDNLNLYKENKELKEYSQRMENQRENYYKEYNKYRSALEEIQKMILSAWEQGKYLDGGLYNDLINEFSKINEVLGE